METKNFDENTKLNSFQFIPEMILAKLSEFHIQTIGQLLSATRGLTKADSLFTSDEEKIVLSMLYEMVPPDVRQEHETFFSAHPTGLITKKDEDHEEENSDNRE